MYVHVSELSEFNRQEPIPMQPRFYTGVYREIDFAISEACVTPPPHQISMINPPPPLNRLTGYYMKSYIR